VSLPPTWTAAGLALAAWGMWLVEVLVVRGWEGLAWLQGFQWASVPASVAAASCWLVAMDGKVPRSGPLAIASAGVLAGFVVARNGLYAVGSLIFMFTYGAAGAWLVLGQLALGLALSTTGLWWAARLSGHAPTRWHAARLTAMPVLSIPLAMLTIAVVPALNGSQDFLHAIKMGYPLFWAVLLLRFAALEMPARMRHS
jgi:hypothetical protein